MYLSRIDMDAMTERTGTLNTEKRPVNNIEVLAGVLTGIVRDHSSHLTMRQMAVLLNVRAGQNEPTVRGIAVALGLSKPAISRALDRLGREGFVERLPDPNDHRSVIVNILPAGWTMFKTLEGIKPQALPDQRSLDDTLKTLCTDTRTKPKSEGAKKTAGKGAKPAQGKAPSRPANVKAKPGPSKARK